MKLFKAIEPFQDMTNNFNDFMYKYNQELQQKQIMLQQDTLKGNIQDIQLKLKSFEDTMNTLQQDVHVIAGAVKKIGYLLANPEVLWKGIWAFTVESSFWICTFICIGAVVLYVIGNKKGAVWAKGSIVGYAAIKMIDVALKITG